MAHDGALLPLWGNSPASSYQGLPPFGGPAACKILIDIAQSIKAFWNCSQVWLCTLSQNWPARAFDSVGINERPPCDAGIASVLAQVFSTAQGLKKFEFVNQTTEQYVCFHLQVAFMEWVEFILSINICFSSDFCKIVLHSQVGLKIVARSTEQPVRTSEILWFASGYSDSLKLRLEK